MILKFIFTCLIALTLCSCSLVANGVAAMIEESNQAEEVSLQEDKVVVFQDLLKQGWKIQIYKQKVLLIKETENGFIVNDVFEVLKDN